MRKSTVFCLFAATAALAAASTVFAVEGAGREFNFAERSLEINRRVSSANMTGSLICQMAEQNDGAACEIKLREANTGVIYTLENANTARQLFNEGIREVAVTGIRKGDAVFSVQNVKAR